MGGLKTARSDSKYFVSKESAVAYAKEIITKKIDYFEREIAELRERLSGL